MRTGGDDQIDRGDCDAARPGPAGQVITCLPHNLINRQLWNRPCKLPQDGPFRTPASAVPEFKLHRRAPPCLPGDQRSLYTGTNGWIAARAKHVNPGRCVDEDHGVNPSGESLEVLVARSGWHRCLNTE